MNFQDQLNEIRKRAGILNEQLRDPESEGWMEKERDEASAAPEQRQYVDAIKRAFTRLHDMAQRGYQETKHEGYLELVKIMGEEFSGLLELLGAMRESITRTQIPNTFEEQLDEIQRLAGLKEDEVDTSFMARRQQQMGQQKEDEVAEIQTEIQEILETKYTLISQLVAALAAELKLQLRRRMLLHPEQTEGMTLQELQLALVKSGELNKYMDNVFGNMEDEIRMWMRKT